ncbi:tail fiber domain-containing protein [bacterium]|nr:tail fiber domain-containing protein [bacterium]
MNAKHFTGILLVLWFASNGFSQKMTVKDSQNNVLMEVNDEGTAGSVSLPQGSAPGTPAGKLYNVGGSLYWSGSALGTAGSAGGWTDGGTNVYVTTTTDKVAIGTSTPEFKLTVTDDGGIIAKGTYDAGATLSTTGGGARLIWYPRKAAFRAGLVDDSAWNDANIGAVSMALGYNTVASGGYSTAIGRNTTASGTGAMALGFNTEASGGYATAMGRYTTADSYVSMAVGRYNVGGGSAGDWIGTDPLFEIGNGADGSNLSNAVTVLKNGHVGIGTATPEFCLSLDNDGGIVAKGTYASGATLSNPSGPVLIWYPRKAAFRAGHSGTGHWSDANTGNYSAATGYITIASGEASTATGYNNTASGIYSTAMGAGNTASGIQATAMGSACTASGVGSIAIGFVANAESYASVATGRYNVGGGTTDSWVATDPLFEIGNGADGSNLSNALTVLKNGNVGIGTATPGSALQVNGKTATTQLQVGTSATSGYILTADASGNATWQAPSGGGSGWTDGGTNVYVTTTTDKVAIGTSTPEFKLTLDDDGGIIAKGTYNSGASLTTSGAGTRMIWYPKKAAFRSGVVDGTQWDDANIGFGSIAMGGNAVASDDWAVSLGGATSASGEMSVAIGYEAEASVEGAVAIGYHVKASGGAATALGYETKSESYVSTAIGQYNIGGGSPGDWIDTDPLFEIGNGTDDTHRSNAVTVLKNGNVGLGTATPEFKLDLDTDGGIIARGTYGSGADLDTDGSGVRMIWYPKKAAFRAGDPNGAAWDVGSVGGYSAAFGYSTTASGDNSFTANGANDAAGNNASAFGYATTAGGTYSMTAGYFTAAGYNAMAVGRWNVGSGSTSAWNTTDPLFEIGNGTGSSARANAVTVLKNGNVGIGNATPGYLLTMEASGGGYYSTADHDWHTGSSRNLKQDIAPNDIDVLRILNDVQIVKYRYRSQAAENPDAPYHVGFIAEDTPEMLTGEARNSMSTGHCVGLLLAIVKEQQKRIEALEAANKP